MVKNARVHASVHGAWTVIRNDVKLVVTRVYYIRKCSSCLHVNIN